MASVQEFTRYMKESGQQSTLDQLGRTGGGIERAAAQWGGPQQQTSQQGQTQMAQNPVDIAKQMYSLANQFRQPAITTLQGQQPGITQAYQGLSTAAAGQKPTIEQRYQDTLQQITATTRGAAAKEFTARGIPLSSGLVEQSVGQQLAPQIQQAATQRDVNLQGVDQLLAQIGMGEQGAQTGLAQAIAAIQAGASPEAITSAQNIYGQQQAAQQNALQNQLAQQQLELKKQQTAYDIGKPYYAPTTGGGGFDAITQSLLTNLLGGGGQTTGGGQSPSFSPTKNGAIYEQPDGSIWRYQDTKWVQM